jgi:hypothetical protein
MTTSPVDDPGDDLPHVVELVRSTANRRVTAP